uniref:Uncharacterized protein n=2 Tax=Clytia hemisphaerica TaxID=252671 RepID=A0A7M5UXJ5_9CNID
MPSTTYNRNTTNRELRHREGAHSKPTKDMCKAFDKRFKNFTFTSLTPKLDTWEGSTIANDVFDEEYNIKHFKSTEEQLTWRLETWIDKCRIVQYDENGDPIINSSGKFHSAKRFRKQSESSSNGAFSKVRSFSLGRAFSKSIENLYKHHEVKIDTIVLPGDDEFEDEKLHYATESMAAARIAPSKSTNDLLCVETEKRRNNDSLKRRSIQSMGVLRNSSPIEQQVTPSKPKINKLLTSFAGKMKSAGKSSSKNKKNRNSMDFDAVLSENNNNSSFEEDRSRSNRLRPSVLDFVRNINSSKNNRMKTEADRRPHTIARSTSVVARPLPSPDYQSQTLFKTRRHNDSVKRVKTKTLNIRPHSTGPLTNGRVFFDPDSPITPDSPVRTDICDV